MNIIKWYKKQRELRKKYKSPIKSQWKFSFGVALLASLSIILACYWMPILSVFVITALGIGILKLTKYGDDSAETKFE